MSSQDEILQTLLNKMSMGQTDDVRRLLAVHKERLDENAIVFFSILSDVIDKIPLKLRNDLILFSGFFNIPFFGELIELLSVTDAPDFNEFHNGRERRVVFADAEFAGNKPKSGDVFVDELKKPISVREIERKEYGFDNFLSNKSSETIKWWETELNKIMERQKNKIEDNGLIGSSAPKRNMFKTSSDPLKKIANHIDNIFADAFLEKTKYSKEVEEKIIYLSKAMGRYETIAELLTWRAKLDTVPPDGRESPFPPYTAKDVRMMMARPDRSKKKKTKK